MRACAGSTGLPDTPAACAPAFDEGEGASLDDVETPPFHASGSLHSEGARAETVAALPGGLDLFGSPSAQAGGAADDAGPAEDVNTGAPSAFSASICSEPTSTGDVVVFVCAEAMSSEMGCRGGHALPPVGCCDADVAGAAGGVGCAGSACEGFCNAADGRELGG